MALTPLSARAFDGAPIGPKASMSGFVPAVLLLAGIVYADLATTGAILAGPAIAQERTSGDAVVKQVASGLYFFFDFDGSNSVFLVTDEGVLVIDTRTHPRDGRDLLDRIRKVTDKPIKWVINSHFHGDHYMGNSVFKEAGATFVAHEETARLMQQVHPKEMARRIDGFKRRGYDPDEVKLVLPDVTFDSKLRTFRTITESSSAVGASD